MGRQGAWLGVDWGVVNGGWGVAMGGQGAWLSGKGWPGGVVKGGQRAWLRVSKGWAIFIALNLPTSLTISTLVPTQHSQMPTPGRHPGNITVGCLRGKGGGH